MFKNMLKRSWLSIIRKPSRSVILVLILFVMANMLLATVSIKNSVDKSTQFAKDKIGGIVYLQPDTAALQKKIEAARSSGTVPNITPPTVGESLATDIAQNESRYLKDSTYSIVASANSSGYTVVQTAQNQREQAFQSALNNAKNQANSQVNQFNAQRDQFNSSQDSAPKFFSRGFGSSGSGSRPHFNFNFNFNFADPTLGRGDTEIQGINSSAFISDAENGSMKIVEGKAFDETTAGGVIISSELADKNSLKVGSNISFKRTSDSKVVSFKIVGIYEDSTQDFNYNTVYTNIDSAKEFLSSDELKSLTVQDVRYYLASAGEKDAFLAATLAKYPEITKNGLKLDIDDTSYQTMVGPIQNVGSFAVTVLWIVIVATVAIITLIVVINVKDRRYEMGVLLSLGALRSSILGQIFIELVLVGTIGFAASLGTSQLLAQKMGDALLQQQVTASQQTDSSTSGRGLFAGGGVARFLGGSRQSNVQPIKTIDVSAGVQEYALLFGIGYLILIVSMILPGINILRYQPKTILTGKE